MYLMAESANISLPFTWGDFLIGLLIIAATVAIVALTVVFIKLAGTLKGVNKLIKDNSEALDTTLKKLPGIATSADETLANVNSITGSINTVVTDVGELVSTFTTPDGPTGTIASVAGAVVSVVQIVKELKDKK